MDLLQDSSGRYWNVMDPVSVRWKERRKDCCVFYSLWNVIIAIAQDKVYSMYEYTVPILYIHVHSNV